MDGVQGEGPVRQTPTTTLRGRAARALSSRSGRGVRLFFRLWAGLPRVLGHSLWLQLIFNIETFN